MLDVFVLLEYEETTAGDKSTEEADSFIIVLGWEEEADGWGETEGGGDEGDVDDGAAETIDVPEDIGERTGADELTIPGMVDRGGVQGAFLGPLPIGPKLGPADEEGVDVIEALPGELCKLPR